MKKIINTLLIISSSLIISCSASTGSRYEENEDNKKKESTKPDESIAEDFDMSPYKTKIEIEEKPGTEDKTNEDNYSVWYEYEEPDTTGSKERIIIGKEYGFRVQVLATDNLEEADSLRTDIYFKAAQKDVYVVFDPPFYKVLVGDFKQLNDAKNLSFRLNQIGYTESRVISDTVNVFQQ